MSESLVFDIEANGLLKTVDRIWCLSIAPAAHLDDVQVYTCDPNDEYDSIEEGVSRLSQADRVIAHNNIGYDYPVLEKLYPGSIRFEQLWDTMVVGGLLEPWRRDLTLAGYGRELKFPKDDFNPEDYGVTWATVDQSRAAWEHMVRYCPIDTKLCGLVYQDQGQKLGERKARNIDMRQSIALEHRVQWPLVKQMEHGFRLDVAAAEALDLELRDELDERERELLEVYPAMYKPERADWDFKRRQWVNVRTFTPKRDNKSMGYVGNAPLTKVELAMFNPGSDTQCAQRLSQLHAWAPSVFTDKGQPKMSDDVLELLEYPEVDALRRYKRVSKMLSQLSGGDSAWLKNVTPEGYVHGYVKSNGARTYRMAHSRPNMAQVDKKDSRMRAVWLPDLGDDIVGCDADGLELRLLACYLYPVDGGAYAEAVLHGSKEDGTDPHTLNQKAVGLYSRDSAKTFFYAMVYGAGDGKLGKIVCEDAAASGKPRPEGSLVQIGRAARARIESGITGLGELIAAVQAKAGRVGYLKLPDGRPVKTGKRIALNSLLQGAGAVVMKQALVTFEWKIAFERELHGHFHYLANVHDEVQFSAEPDYSEKVGQAFADAIQAAGEKLGLPVPMLGSYDIGATWADTH